MGLFRKLFGNRHEESRVHYKEKLRNTMGPSDLDLPNWLQKEVFTVIEKEEQHRTYDEMKAWLENWTEAGRLPEQLEQERLLDEIYAQHRQWVEKTDEFYRDIYEDSDLKIMEEEFGKQYAGMPRHLQKTYFALFAEIMNAFAQVDWKH